MGEEAPEVLLESVADRAQELLSPPVVYLPIRHHSPACAFFVQQIIKGLSPTAVLVEGPPSFDDQIDLLLDPHAKMPLAIYSHASFETPAPEDAETIEPHIERTGSYFPLCDYSPELVALRAGREVGARLGFCDLDYNTMRSQSGSLAGHTDERFLFSQTLTAAAAELGCRDHNELWDQMVEGADHDTVDHVTAVLTYGVLARAGASTDDGWLADSAAREFAMAARIATEIQKGDGTTVVVTGAFHTVVLPELVRAALNNSALQKTGPELGTSKLPEAVESGHGLIRYSFERLDGLAGYSAGMANPRWYQMEWERRTANTGSTPSEQVISEVAATIRQFGNDGQPSLPSVVDATVAVEQLHHLRGRTLPARLDVVDAMVSCFVKGQDTPNGIVRTEAHRSMTGFDLGAVPPQTPRVPLALDFDRRATELGFDIATTEPKQVNLDVYRSERDRERSRFLHGLVGLEINFGSCISPLRFSRTAGRDLIRERWNVRIDGSTDVTLTEASKWGAQLDEAVAARTMHALTELVSGEHTAADLMAFVRVAAERGVHSVVTQALEELRSRIGVDPSLVSVVAALSEAELLWLGREPLGGSTLAAMPELAEQLYVRACQLGDHLADLPEQDWLPHVQALAAIHRMLLTETWDVDPDLFRLLLAHQKSRVAPGILRGAIDGLQWRDGVLNDAGLLSGLGSHTGAGSLPTAAAGYVNGLIAVARDALWTVDGVVPLLTTLIVAPDSDTFLTLLPALRSAFSSLTPSETDRVAESVMLFLGEAFSPRITGISEHELVANTAVSAKLEDQLRSDGFASWITESSVEVP